MTKSIEYKVLARKYRPKKFKDLVGQDVHVEILSNSIKRERIANSYMLTGVRGVGKTTTARIIAMSINCKKRTNEDFEPCGVCETCSSIENDNNLDVIEMDAASNTGVDDIREIIDNIKYKPITSKYKIFIIDEVHMLSKSAFNALLKTLEEPPEHVKFIFATTEVKKIPITVLSRCQRFDLHRIENYLLAKHLKNIAKFENIEIDDEAIALLVRAADGSMRDGLSLIDQASNNDGKNITTETIIKMLGLAEREKIFNLLEKILEGNSSEALNLYNKLYRLGADVNMIFDEMLNVVHFITQLKIAPKLQENIYISELERTKGYELSSRMNINNLNIIWQILFKGFEELQKGFHNYQHGEMIILRLIYYYEGPLNDDKKVIKDIKASNLSDTLEDKQNNDTKDNITNYKSEDKSLKQVQNNISINNFRQFVDLFYKKREGILHSILYNNVTLISFSEGNITINIQDVKYKHFNRTVAKHISTWTGRIWQINESSSNIGKSLLQEDIINQQKEIELMKNKPEVKKILNEFPGSSIHNISDLANVEYEDDNYEFISKKEK